MKAKIISFQVNSTLMYLIQSLTKESSVDILSYFSDMANCICNDAAHNSKAKWYSVNTHFFYKETEVPFKLAINSCGNQKLQKEVGYNVTYQAIVSFPCLGLRYNVEEIASATIESSLGLSNGGNWAQFNKPKIKLPRCLKNRKKK